MGEATDTRPLWSVDVKAFCKVEVRADTAEQAEAEAKRIVEHCAPLPDFADGWNGTRQSEEAGAPFVVSVSGFDCEDAAYIEDEEGDEVQGAG